MDKTTGIISLDSISTSKSFYDSGSSIVPDEFQLTDTHGAFHYPAGWKLSNTWMPAGMTEKESLEMQSGHKWTIVVKQGKQLPYAHRVQRALNKKGRDAQIVEPDEEIPEDSECVVFLLDPYPSGQQVANQVVEKHITRVFIEDTQLWNVKCGFQIRNYLQVNGVEIQLGKLLLMV